MIFLIVLSSCERTNYSSIPSVPVNLQLNLSTDYKDLKIPNRLFFFEKRDQMKGIYAVGYGGILVYSYLDSQGIIHFAAFDLSCPYESKKDIRISAVEDNSFFVRCEKCGSTFDISRGFGFATAASKTKESLKRYQCRKGRIISYETVFVSQ